MDTPCFGDYDSDGDWDLVVAGYDESTTQGGLLLVANQGEGSFKQSSLPHNNSDNVRWLDVDNDGLLDMYVSGAGRPNLLYHNNGDGTFTDIAAEAGVNVQGDGQGVAIGDYDGDGDADILNANPPRMFRNNGNLDFSDVTEVLFPDWAGFTRVLGGLFLDYDNDLDLDVMICETLPEYQLRLYRNDGATFPEVSGAAQLTGLGSWSPVALDYDHDGDLDLFAPDTENGGHYLLRNDTGVFVNVTNISGVGAALADSAGSSLADPDHDGDLDILASNREPISGHAYLYRNDAATGNWVILDLEGRASNRSAFGARAILSCGGSVQMRELSSGHGNSSQSEPLLHFGLGSCSLVDQIEIRWPSGQVTHLTSVPANQRIHVVEQGDLPDLEAVSLTVSPLEGHVGDALQVVVRMRNLTASLAHSATFEVRAGAVGGQLQEVDECTATNIGPDQDASCAVLWITSGLSAGQTRVVAELVRSVPGDINAANNSVETVYELLPERDTSACVLEGIRVEPAEPYSPQDAGAVSLVATLWNMGTVVVQSGQVRFSYDDPTTGIETVVTTVAFGPLEGIERAQVSTNLVTTGFGVEDRITVRGRGLNLVPPATDPGALVREGAFAFAAAGAIDDPPTTIVSSPSASPLRLSPDVSQYRIVGSVFDDRGIATVTVAGEAIGFSSFGDNAVFAHDVALLMGRNQFTVEAGDTGGNSVAATVVIIRGPEEVPALTVAGVTLLLLLAGGYWRPRVAGQR